MQWNLSVITPQWFYDSIEQKCGQDQADYPVPLSYTEHGEGAENTTAPTSSLGFKRKHSSLSPSQSSSPSPSPWTPPVQTTSPTAKRWKGSQHAGSSIKDSGERSRGLNSQDSEKEGIENEQHRRPPDKTRTLPDNTAHTPLSLSAKSFNSASDPVVLSSQSFPSLDSAVPIYSTPLPGPYSPTPSPSPALSYHPFDLPSLFSGITFLLLGLPAGEVGIPAISFRFRALIQSTGGGGVQNCREAWREGMSFRIAHIWTHTIHHLCDCSAWRASIGSE